MSSSSNHSSITFPKTINNFIGGKFVEPTSSEYLDSYEPSSGKVLLKIADSEAADVDKAVEAAKKGAAVWAALSINERNTLIYRLADLIEQNLQVLAEAESRDSGKPLSLAKAVDIPRASKNFRFFAQAVAQHQDHSTTERLPNGGGLLISYSQNAPVGVAGLISPWNLPLYLLTWKIAPAIATGNACVCKPSEITSATAFMLCQLVKQSGIPDGVINMVFGYGHKVGQRLVEHPDVPLISFTGGTVTGERIMKCAASQHKKVSLELGGKNPNIIFDDADLERAVETTLKSSFANQGEICLCGSRIFVQQGIYETFVKNFVEAIQTKLRVGDPFDPATTTGALVSAQHRDKVAGCIALAKQEGGKIEIGGGVPTDLPASCANGYFLQPTVITGLDPIKCQTQQEEIFGPVVTISPFSDEQQAIEYANSVKYGLSASVWTENISRANRVATALEAGTVWINCWLMRELKMPFGGWKHSGVGREGGEYSIEFFTEQKAIQVFVPPK